jgi:hypothetical protein
MLRSYDWLMRVSVTDAKNMRSELVLSRKPTDRKRMLGTLNGKIQVLDPNWWRPMTDNEVKDFLAWRD